MMTLLLLQSRRFGLTFAILLLAAPIWVLALSLEGMPLSDAAWTAFSAIGGLYLALAGLIVLALRVPGLRGWRVAAETTALATVILGLLAVLLPGPTLGYALCIPSGAAAIWIALYGPLSRLIPRRVTLRENARVHIPLPHQMVWRMALPTRPAEHWDPLLRSSVQDSEDVDTFHLEYACGGGETDAVTVTMLEIEPNRGYRYLFQGETSGVGRAFVQGYHRIVLTPDGDEATWVELSRQTEECLLAQAFLSWLDRMPEDYARFLRASTLGESMDGTLTGLHRLAVLREELGRKRKLKRPKLTAQRGSAILRAAAAEAGALLSRTPSLISW
ncbi:hypothetical protein [Jannaschia seohaensis]|uniref:Polyketide cyclase / dehydrase and lipid transport n=1 Tax=Jannaschia seohaensis TaxID=475081 RepID=A0A2Y9B3Z4_9RHOB|nr:hypothetical protein [Jannaschia seohaensis]PWJ12121.1 hypothetical protein BCF38_11756 [Jannaschia seohaensis]SSA51224.1 hypothetical protein SAMN05421539_11756 [Jannaschia seohaensis]